MRERIGRYRVLRKLGEGGMGVVFAARDEKLDRDIAIKVIHGSADAEIRERILREARAEARVNHPHVCQIYEIGEEAGEPFIAMELLEGEPLGSRIAKGALPSKEALKITAEVLDALETLHRREVIHRDLKPANIFLTAHGTKVLDFGLARPGHETGDQTEVQLTRPGTLMGTPRYMAPEQWDGAPAGPSTDLFAVGAILFEMVTGKPAFDGATLPEICRSILTTKPPALAGAGTAALDRIIDRALQKQASNRYPNAGTMLADVRAAMNDAPTGEVAPVRSMTRLIVLPFRMLRPDPDLDFLAVSIPEAVSASLAGLQSLVVRSSMSAAKFAGENPDLRRIAAEAEVDAVLTGTMLKSGDKVRVSVQLVEAPSGTLRTSKTAQVAMTDLFQLEDELVRQIVAALSIPLSPHENSMLGRDVPANPQAYEIYLRATQIPVTVSSTSMLRAARDLYTACLDEDPKYAPAWARLGRICRLMAKYGHDDVASSLKRADEAFANAFRLNPDLPLAHNLYTNFEIEDLGRPKEAMIRLIGRLKISSADPNLFVGLSMALRFCGLLDASLAANARAIRLDPSIKTGAHYALWLLGRYEEAIARDIENPSYMKMYTLMRLGRNDEAIAILRGLLAAPIQGTDRHLFTAMLMGLEGDRKGAIEALRSFPTSAFRDPEGLLHIGLFQAKDGDPEGALETLRRVIAGGYLCDKALEQQPWLDGVRARPEYIDLCRQSAARRAEAAAEFVKAGGPELLGVKI